MTKTNYISEFRQKQELSIQKALKIAYSDKKVYKKPVSKWKRVSLRKFEKSCDY